MNLNYTCKGCNLIFQKYVPCAEINKEKAICPVCGKNALLLISYKSTEEKQLINIQKSMSGLFGNACYAFCIAWMFSNENERKDIKYLTSKVLEGWINGWIDDDGYVSKPVEYANAVLGTSKPIIKDVVKVKINSLSDLPEKGYWAVEWDYGTGKHFVVCDRNGIVFDSWPESSCVTLGKPTSYRKYI